MSYELWNAETKNLIDEFDREDDALDAVERLVRAYGEAFVRELVLAFEDDEGETRQIAAADDLIRLATNGARDSDGDDGQPDEPAELSSRNRQRGSDDESAPPISAVG